MFTDYFGFETQASYNTIKVTSAFISGKTRRYDNSNLLGGLRAFTMSPERNVRLYFNLLLGYRWEKVTNESGVFNSRQLGLSTSAFMRHRMGLFYGIAIEGDTFIMLKLGYAIGLKKSSAAKVPAEEIRL